MNENLSSIRFDTTHICIKCTKRDSRIQVKSNFKKLKSSLQMDSPALVAESLWTDGKIKRHRAAG